MPDDNVLANTDNPTDTPSKVVDKGTDKTPPTESYVTSEALKDQMEDMKVQFNSAMRTFGEQVSGAIKGGQAPVEPKVDPTLNEKQNALLDDPDKYIDDRAREIAGRRQGEDILLNDAYARNVAVEKTEFEERYGADSWKDMIEDDLNTAAGNMPSEMRASAQHIKMLVRGLKGGIEDDKLMEARTKAMEVEKERSAPPEMIIGTGQPRPKGADLTSDETEYLATLSRNGISYSKEEYIRDRDAGVTEDDFPVEDKK